MIQANKKQEKPIEQIEKEIKEKLDNKKVELAAAQKEVQDDDIELGEEDRFDPYYVPDEIQKAFPGMHFHNFELSARGLSKASRLRYSVVHIPDTKECEELRARMSLEPRTGIVNSLGSDVYIYGDTILCMCPEKLYKRRKEGLQNARLQKEKEEALKAKYLKRTIGGDIKRSQISVTHG